jgi:DNA-directed RNA polymerase II subunit RPB1
MTKRALSPDEKEDILRAMKTMHPDPNFMENNNLDPNNNFVIDNARRQVLFQLNQIEIYPDMIPLLKKEILHQYSLSIISPGEMVGCIAATSIGEGQTQESLNAFHSSGQLKSALTGGLPRFKELLDLSHQMKTPNMKVYFNPKYGSLLEKSNPNSLRFVRQLIHTQLELVKMSHVILSYTIEVNPVREWWYSAFTMLYSDDHLNCTHRLRLQLNPKLLYKCKKDMVWIASKIEKTIRTKGTMHIAFSDNYTAQLDIWVDPSNLSSCEEILLTKDIDKEDIEKMRRYITDENMAEICLHNVVLPLVMQTEISGLPGLVTCYTNDPHDEHLEYFGDTRGGSLKDLLALDCVDVRRCESNNVHEIYELFGIEAAYKFLISEFRKVSKSVSHSHLEVMIDWMCSTGKLTSVNRHGQDISKIGPMAKASFEQPLDAFVKAASSAQTEVITGVSASIATGNLAHIGTGSFQMMLDLKTLAKYAADIDNQTPSSANMEDILDMNDDIIDETSGIENEQYMDDEYFDNAIDEDEIL